MSAVDVELLELRGRVEAVRVFVERRVKLGGPGGMSVADVVGKLLDGKRIEIFRGEALGEWILESMPLAWRVQNVEWR